MAAYIAFDQTVEDWLEGVYTMTTDQFTVVFTTEANAPTAADSVLADITTIGTGGVVGSLNLTGNASASQTGGTYSMLFTDLVIDADATVGPFQRIVIYNETAAGGSTDALLCQYDFGSALTLENGDSLTLNWTGSTLTLTSP